MLRDLEPRVIAECLTTMARLDAAELADLGRKSRACWERELTPPHVGGGISRSTIGSRALASGASMSARRGPGAAAGHPGREPVMPFGVRR